MLNIVQNVILGGAAHVSTFTSHLFVTFFSWVAYITIRCQNNTSPHDKLLIMDTFIHHHGRQQR